MVDDARARAKQVLAHISIYEVLRRLGVDGLIDGQTQQMRCLIHDDQHPSARVYSDGHIHCWTCGTSWDALSLLQAKFGYTFGQALSWLEGRFVIPSPLVGGDAAMRVAVRHRPPPDLTALAALVETRLRAARNRLSCATYTKYWLAFDLMQYQCQELHVLTPDQWQQHLTTLLQKVSRC